MGQVNGTLPAYCKRRRRQYIKRYVGYKFPNIKDVRELGVLIKRPSSRHSVKAFKEQMQIGSAATKDTEDKRLKENHLRTNLFFKLSKHNMDFPTRQLLFIIYTNKLPPRRSIRSKSITFTDNTHVNF